MPQRWRRSAAVAVVGLIGAAGMTACSSTDDGAGDRPLVGVAMPTTTSDRWIADGENVQAQLEALAYEVDLRYADDDVPTQVQQLQEMIDEGKEVELNCHFCNTNYKFSVAELKELRDLSR